MKTLIRIEEAAICIISIFILFNYDYGLSWWLFGLLFFLPDVGMIGYVVNNRIGSITYNLTHHKAVGIILFFTGYFFKIGNLELAGIVLVAHSSFDRVLGYGLKYPDSFKNTSLGTIGRHVA